MLAGAVESKVMGGYLKAFVRKFGGLEFIFRIDHDVENAVANLTDEMLVPPGQRIEMLRSSKD